MTHSPVRGGLALFAVLSAISITNVSAQNTSDPWLPWHGCWRADGAPAGEMLCIVPDGGGIRLVTLTNGQVQSESRVIADNKPRAVRQEGCSGNEVARWSADKRRVFLISQLTCDERIARQVSGIFAITGPNDWISAQAVTIEGKTATRSVLYLAANPASVPASIINALHYDRAVVERARTLAAAEVTEAEINEANTNVEAIAVQEWLNASGQPFQIDGVASAGGTSTNMSALDLVGRASNTEVANYAANDQVVAAEQPITYVNTTYVNNVVRSCWDPFWAGYVIGVTGGLNVGVSYGRPFCGGHFYSRYSPWGYDLYGWHWVPAPVVFINSPRIIRTRPIFIHRGGVIHRDFGDDRRNDHRDDRNDSWGGRATRDGYTRDNNFNRNDGSNRGDRGSSTGGSTRASGDNRWSNGNRGGNNPPRSGGTRTQSDKPPTGGNQAPPPRSNGDRSASTRSSGRATSDQSSSGYSRGSSSSSSSTGRTARPRSNH